MEVTDLSRQKQDHIDVSDYAFSEIPFSEIQRVGQRSLLYNDLFCVSWLLGRYCNYSCSYCWPYASTKTKDHRPYELLERTMNEIKRQARERGFQSFHFSFSGGEPTLHPDFLRLVRHHAEETPRTRYQSFHMTTNLSQSRAWLAQFAQATENLHRVSVTASFHKEFAKRELFRDKLLDLLGFDVQATINMVLSPTRFDLLWEDALYFHEAGLNVTLKPQSDEKAAKIVPGYSEEQLRLLREGLPQRDYTASRLRQFNRHSNRPKAEGFTKPSAWDQKTGQTIPQTMQVELEDQQGRTWYMDQAERFNAFEFNRFKGWDCSAGYRSLIIREPDGMIKRGYSCADQPLGTLETGFRLFDNPAPCQSASCVSSADSKIPKRRADSKRPLWPGEKPPC